MAINRFFTLKGKLTKTFRSVEYILNNKDMSKSELEQYTQGIHKGVMKLLRRDSRAFIDSIHAISNIRVVVKGTVIAVKALRVSELVGDITYEDINPDKLSDKIHAIIHQYISVELETTTGENSYSPYVHAILTEYMSLTNVADTDRNPVIRINGKLDVY